MDCELEDRLVREISGMLDSMLAEEDIGESEDFEVDTGKGTVPRVIVRREKVLSLTRLSALQIFLPDGLLEKLKYVTNRSLHCRVHRLTTCQEILGSIVVHVLCASYGEGPNVVCDPDEKEFFFFMGLSAERYRHMWSFLTGSEEKRAPVDY